MNTDLRRFLMGDPNHPPRHHGNPSVPPIAEDDTPALAGLDFSNLLLEISDGGAGDWYTPNTSDIGDQRLLPLPDEYRRDAQELRSQLQARWAVPTRRTANKTTRFNHDLGQIRFRVTVLPAERDEVWMALRRIPPVVPSLPELGIRQTASREMHHWLRQPGLTVICGTYNAGKTTTACALLRHYILTHGGLAIAVESPTEFFLHGPMGDHGRCIQIPVDEEDDGAWRRIAADVRKASPAIIFIGEISTPAIARAALGLSTTGRPILTTTHGGSHLEALQTIIDLANDQGPPTTRLALARNLVGIAHQTLDRGAPDLRLLTVTGHLQEPAIRDAIASEHDEAFQEFADHQTAALALHDNTLDHPSS